MAFNYPHLTSYILPAFYQVAESGKVFLDVLYGPTPPNLGFGHPEPFEHPNVRWYPLKEIKPLGTSIGMYQIGLVSYIIRERPDLVMLWGNPRYISFWLVLLFGRISGIPIFVRGHGLFKKSRVNLPYRLMYTTILRLCTRYVCYTPGVKESLKPLTKNEEKLVVDYNSLYNSYTLHPDERTGEEKGILYLGRVRQGCGVEALVQAVKTLNQQGREIELHVIGGGPLHSYIAEEARRHLWLKYYGEEYSPKKIREISRHCRFGCLPRRCVGLNVVHMMSLSLPVVSHRVLSINFGPEGEYIKHGWNGWLIPGIDMANNIPSLLEGILKCWELPKDEMHLMQQHAFETYQELQNPPLHERWLRIWGV